jgi:transcriptional regulator with XRE-family HTH domain
MPSTAREGIGRRLAAIRISRHKTQETLAKQANISLSLLRKIEQGSRSPSDHVLHTLADALATTAEQITGHAGSTDSRVHTRIEFLRTAIGAYDFPDDGPVRPLRELEVAVDTTVRQRLTSQYGLLIADIPALLGELNRAVRVFTGRNATHAHRLLAMALRGADSVAYKFNYYDLSNHIIQLMRWSAHQSEDEILTATVAYIHTETFFANGDLERGLRRLEAAIEAAPEPTDSPSMAARGALHMRAAIVAARLVNTELAFDHLRHARILANAVPEGIYYGTAFGPSSLHVHEVSLWIELGDATGALKAARNHAPPSDLPAERHSHYYLSVALAQLWLGMRDDALQSLQVARRIAPQHVREHPQVRDALVTLLRLYRSPPQQLLSFAEWARAI